MVDDKKNKVDKRYFLVLAEWFAMFSISSMIVLPILSVLDGLGGIVILIYGWISSVFVFFVEAANTSFNNKGYFFFSKIAKVGILRVSVYFLISTGMFLISCLQDLYIYIIPGTLLVITSMFYFLDERRQNNKAEVTLLKEDK
eukprot:GHVP01003286.1.p1 GENE.GHVP01003286.1~~GHVP01003286.1.p1  ORF type:complete len:143 (-),score=15.91 GHVP01003286.1:207-635(-)